MTTKNLTKSTDVVTSRPKPKLSLFRRGLILLAYFLVIAFVIANLYLLLWHFQEKEQIKEYVSTSSIKFLMAESLERNKQHQEHKTNKSVNTTEDTEIDKTKLIDKNATGTGMGAISVPCRPVFFIGGGKSGSTMLASWLKHGADTGYRTYSASSGFLDGGKEICVGIKKRHDPGSIVSWFVSRFSPTPPDMDHCPPDRPYMLDACPAVPTFKSLEVLNNVFPSAKFVLLARDPVDRVVSHINDNRPPRHIPNIDQQVKAGKHSSFSMFGRILSDALKSLRRDQVIVVINEMMKAEPQAVMDDVYDFIGHERMTINITAPRANSNQDLKNGKYYSRPSEEVVKIAQKMFQSDTKLFVDLIGTGLPWKTAQSINATDFVKKPKMRVAGYYTYVRQHTKEAGKDS